MTCSITDSWKPIYHPDNMLAFYHPPSCLFDLCCPNWQTVDRRKGTANPRPLQWYVERRRV